MKKRLLAILFCSLLTISLTACPHPHNYDHKQSRIEPTCEEPGLLIETCRCGEEKRTQLPVLEHQYEVENELEASCQADGYITYVCTRCQASHTETIALEKYSETEINDMYRDSVGKLFVYDEQGNFVSEGSCFVYSKDGWLITNYHVIRNGCVAEAIIGGHTYNVPVVIACDKAVDIALIKISATDLKPVTICKRVQRTGETVYALGSANGCEAIFTKGKITYANQVSDEVHYTQHDAAIWSGNFGGPLINEYGEVIGINAWAVPDSQNLNSAIHISHFSNLDLRFGWTLKDFYEKNRAPFRKTASYIQEHGSYDQEMGAYLMVTDDFRYSSLDYTIFAAYAPGDNVISFYFVEQGGFSVKLNLNEDCTGSYEWYAFHGDYGISGNVIAEAFARDQTLSYYYANLNSDEIANELRDTAVIAISLICDSMANAFGSLGITAEEFGFISF